MAQGVENPLAERVGAADARGARAQHREKVALEARMPETGRAPLEVLLDERPEARGFLALEVVLQLGERPIAVDALGQRSSRGEM